MNDNARAVPRRDQDGREKRGLPRSPTCPDRLPRCSSTGEPTDRERHAPDRGRLLSNRRRAFCRTPRVRSRARSPRRQLEPLRQAIIAKNQLFFYRWRPQNRRTCSASASTSRGRTRTRSPSSTRSSRKEKRDRQAARSAGEPTPTSWLRESEASESTIHADARTSPCIAASLLLLALPSLAFAQARREGARPRPGDRAQDVQRRRRASRSTCSPPTRCWPSRSR